MAAVANRQLDGERVGDWWHGMFEICVVRCRERLIL